LSPTFDIDKEFSSDRLDQLSGVGSEQVGEIDCLKTEFVNEHQTTRLWYVSFDEPVRIIQSVHLIEASKKLAVCRYDEQQSGTGLLPATVRLENRRDDELRRYRNISLTEFEETPVDDEVFTLKGLGLERGIPVTDIRIHRRIGYWDGTKLVDDPPR
ncbi:MAG: hypothetical protein ACR2NP_15045, partial [Pirellulaceae bacterium]